jgi:copper resistance protein B
MLPTITITTDTAIMDRPAAITGLCLLLGSLSAAAHMEDDPLLAMFSIDELEIHDADRGPLSWDIDGWMGKDLHKFHLQTEGERTDAGTERVEIRALYNHAVAPYWDLQLGLRHDAQPGPARDWLVIGWRGLAPYWFEVDANLFLGEDSRSALRLEAEYEILFTRRWILSPEIEINLHGKDDPALGIGAGLSNIEAGLRLRYEIRREIAPYLGVTWEKNYGRTADFAQAAGEDSRDSELVFGIKAWF